MLSNPNPKEEETMNKRVALTGVSVAVGSLLMIGSAYAGLGDAPGYDAYKSAVKQTFAVQNVTKQMNVTVKDNGTKLLDVQSTVKEDKAKNEMSADINLNGGTASQGINLYRQDGKQIIKASDNDIYNVIEGKQWKGKAGEHRGQAPDGISTEVENVVDALVGNLKDYVTLSPQADGTKNISMQLSGSQIPAVANAIGSLVVKQAANAEGHHKGVQEPFGDKLQGLQDSMPKLTQDVKIDKFDLAAQVNADNRIEKQQMTLTISGKDAQGVSHEVVVAADFGLSNFNGTTPDHIDLNGKQVKTLDVKKHGE